MKKILGLFLSSLLVYGARDEVSDGRLSSYLSAGQLAAATTEVWQVSANSPNDCRILHGTNFYPNFVLSNGAEVSTTVKFPKMMDNRRELEEPQALDPKQFYGLLAYDVLGALEGKGAGAYQVLLQVGKERPLIMHRSKVTYRAIEQFGWPYQVRSESTGGVAGAGFQQLTDHNRQTSWKVNSKTNKAELILDLGRSRLLGGLAMLDGADCAARQFEVSISERGDFGKPILTGTASGSKGEAPVSFYFPMPVKARYVRVRFINKYRWADLGLSELAVFPPGEERFYRSEQRQFIKVPIELIEKYNGKEAKLVIKALSERPVVLGNFEFYRLHQHYTPAMMGSSNKEAGPDEMDMGALGFEGMGYHNYSVMPILNVRPGSPAAKAGLKPQDLLVGVNGQVLYNNSCHPGGWWLAAGFEPVVGRRVQEVMAKSALINRRRKSAKPAMLSLEILRDGKFVKLPVQLKTDGFFSPSFPYNDPFSEQIFKDLCDYLVKQQHDNGAWHHGIREITTCMAGLALIATEDPKYLPAIRKAAKWILDVAPNGVEQNFWKLAYQGIFLAEYYWATGDEQVLPWINRTLEWLPGASHKSKWDLDAFGHDHKGLPYGEKGLVAPGLHCLVFDSLSRRSCRLDSKVWPKVIDYMLYSWSDPAKGGHGAMGYNASYKDTGEAWSRTGNFLLAINIRGEKTELAEPLRDFLWEYHANMFNSHAYGMPGAAWGLVALANADRKAFQSTMSSYSWWFVNAWDPGQGMRYTEAHMGAPYMGRDLMATSAMALILAASKHNLLLTGSRYPGLLKSK